jgi:peptide/nickel transport system substrate-binding protein
MQVLLANDGGMGIPSFISLLDANDKRLKGLGSIPTGATLGLSFAEYVWWAA